MSTINYSALSANLTDADVKTYKSQNVDTFTLASYSYAKYALIAGVILSALVYYFEQNQVDATSGGIWFLPVSISVFVAVTLWYFAYLGRMHAKLWKFADANGAAYERKIKGAFLPSGMIFDDGHSRQVTDRVRFQDGRELGSFQYTTGSGKNAQTHYWMYVSVPMTRHLPNMVLDSKKNNVWKISNLPDTFRKDQQLSLEGDFNNYFTLYAPAEYKTDALYVFTPDVMQAAIDHGAGYDMEIVDDKVFIYFGNAQLIGHFDKVASLLDIADKVGTEIRDQSKRYSDERIGDKSFNFVASEGRRLKSGLGPTGIIVILTIIISTTLWLIGAMSVFVR